MKKRITALGLAVLCVGLLCSGCGEFRNLTKHVHSSFTGLNRHITLYAADGKVIREWDTRAKTEDRGGTVWFVVDGKAVTVSGTFVVEER